MDTNQLVDSFGAGNLVFGGIFFLVTISFLGVIVRYGLKMRARRRTPPAPSPIQNGNEGAPGFGETIRRVVWSLIAIVLVCGAVYLTLYVIPHRLAQYMQGYNHLWSSILTSLLVLAYILASFFTIDEDGLSVITVGPDEVGVVLLLNRPIMNVTSGPVFLPYGLCSLITFPSGEIQKEVPDEPEFLVRNEDRVPVPPGRRPVFRITFAQGGDANNPDPLAQRVTQEVSAIFAFQILNPRVFVRELRDLDTAKRLLEDVVTRTLTELLPSHTLAEVMVRVREFSDQILARLQDRSKTWGTKITQGAIKAIGLSHELNTQLQRPAQAVAAARATVLAAEADRVKRTREGEGDGAASTARLEGIKAGLTQADGSLDDVSRIAVGLETTKALGDKATFFFGARGIEEMAGLAGAIFRGTPANSGSANTDHSPPPPAEGNSP